MSLHSPEGGAFYYPGQPFTLRMAPQQIHVRIAAVSADVHGVEFGAAIVLRVRQVRIEALKFVPGSQELEIGVVVGE